MMKEIMVRRPGVANPKCHGSMESLTRLALSSLGENQT
jgi:hypothetical protein